MVKSLWDSQMERARAAIYKHGVIEYGWTHESISYIFEPMYDRIIREYANGSMELPTALQLIHELRKTEQAYLVDMRKMGESLNALRHENAHLTEEVKMMEGSAHYV